MLRWYEEEVVFPVSVCVFAKGISPKHFYLNIVNDISLLPSPLCKRAVLLLVGSVEATLAPTH